MSESSLWREIRTGLDPFMDLIRINEGFAQGIHDVVWLGKKQAGWIELKYVKEIPTRTFKLGLTTEQALFGMARKRQGWRSSVIAAIGSDYLLFSEFKGDRDLATLMDRTNLEGWVKNGFTLFEKPMVGKWESLAEKMGAL